MQCGAVWCGRTAVLPMDDDSLLRTYHDHAGASEQVTDGRIEQESRCRRSLGRALQCMYMLLTAISLHTPSLSLNKGPDRRLTTFSLQPSCDSLPLHTFTPARPCHALEYFKYACRVHQVRIQNTSSTFVEHFKNVCVVLMS
jgi:hypothetical protein